MREEGLELPLRRTPVAFITLPDQAEPSERDTREFDRFHAYEQAMHGGGVGDHELDRADVHRERDWACALFGAHPAELKDPLAVELDDRPLAASSRFSIASVAVFERPGARPTAFISAICRSIRSPNVCMRAMRDLVGVWPRSI